MRSLVIGTSFVLVVPIASLRAQQSSPGPAADTIPVTPATIESGRKIFHGPGTCVTCHGAALEGTAVAPTLRAHQWRDAKDGELAPIYHVVTHGVPGTLMVSHPGGISDQMAREVAAYIWAVNHRGEKP